VDCFILEPELSNLGIGRKLLVRRITLAVYAHVIGDSHRQAVEKLAAAFGSLDPDGPTAEANSTMIQ